MRNDAKVERWSCLAAVSLVVVVAGCTGGPHRRGERQIMLTGLFAHPFDTDGRGDSAGATIGYNHFLRDRLALMGAITPYRNYNQGDGDVYAAEVQVGLRWYFWEFGGEARPLAVFTEGLAGAVYSSRSVPEEGTCTNLTGEMSVGLETADGRYPLGQRLSPST